MPVPGHNYWGQLGTGDTFRRLRFSPTLVRTTLTICCYSVLVVDLCDMRQLSLPLPTCISARLASAWGNRTSVAGTVSTIKMIGGCWRAHRA